MDETNAENEKLLSAIKGLFLGNVIEQRLFPYPKFNADESETIAMVNESVDRFLGEFEEKFREFDENNAQPESYLEALKELGLFGLIIDEEFGGIGLSSKGYARAVQQVARYDGSTAITIGAHSSIGMKGLLLFGNDEQKKRYLPKLATGEWVAAFCLTEPGAGSDAAGLKTTAVKNEDGSWVLNGEKLWITNGPIAQFYTVFAKTEGENGKMTAFIVERDWEGISTGPKENKLGIRSSATSSVIFNDVRVPPENVLGEEGKGFKIAMSILNNGRTGLGGGCVGAMKRCIALSVKQATERKQFGSSISEFRLIRAKIGQMAVDCFAAESVVQVIGDYIDSGVEDFSSEAAASKIFATEALWRTVNEALQIAGGNGYMKEFPYEMILRDSRINMIFEGTNEILRLFISLSGMKDAGRSLEQIGKAAGNVFNDPIKGFGVMSRYAMKKVSELTSLGAERIEVHAALGDVAKVYELGTLGLGRVTEGVLRRYGKKIIGQQLISKRLADVAIDLFVGLTTLSRVNSLIEEKGVEACTREIELVTVFTAQAKRRMKENLRSVEREEDETLLKVASGILEDGGYNWDLL